MPDYPRWPEELPQVPFGDTPPEYKPQSNVISTAQEAGPAKRRRRFTGRIYDVTVGPIDITSAQRDRLDQFVSDEICDVKPFLWTDFRRPATDTQDAIYRLPEGMASITQKWKGTDQSGVEWWTVTIQMEMKTV
ncbi:hypothetical protein [Terriglobus albidus]|uniref:hypothetical protein n=1 Tax=Terriglobus albidus TaxID=1592106 RepID=UPI0021DFEB90|nr:hypothetical protein [Terriglobus albidus]